MTKNKLNRKQTEDIYIDLAPICILCGHDNVPWCAIFDCPCVYKSLLEKCQK